MKYYNIYQIQKGYESIKRILLFENVPKFALTSITRNLPVSTNSNIYYKIEEI